MSVWVGDRRRLLKIILTVLAVWLLWSVVVFFIGLKIEDKQTISEERSAFVWGDGVHQGCEWCGSRCDAYLRGWDQAEKAAP